MLSLKNQIWNLKYIWRQICWPPCLLKYFRLFKGHCFHNKINFEWSVRAKYDVFFFNVSLFFFFSGTKQTKRVHRCTRLTYLTSLSYDTFNLHIFPLMLVWNTKTYEPYEEKFNPVHLIHLNGAWSRFW